MIHRVASGCTAHFCCVRFFFFPVLQIKFREKSQSNFVAGAEGTLHPSASVPQLDEKSSRSSEINLTDSARQTCFPTGVKPLILKLNLLSQLQPFRLKAFYSIPALGCSRMRLCSQLRRCLAELIRLRQTAGSAAPRGLAPPHLPSVSPLTHLWRSFWSLIS